MAAPGDGAAAGPSPRPEDQWRRVLGGMQRNCQQFGSNLLRLQQAVGKQLSLTGTPGGTPANFAGPAAGAAAPLKAGGAAAASMSQATWSGVGGSGGRGPGAVSKEEVGRATWTFLHTLAAQYPEKPTRQQQRDARNLIDILTRMYPCGECARHFREVVRQSPPAVASRADMALWMCEVHNVVNRRLGKPSFNCALVQSRWSSLECGEGEQQDACSLDMGARRR